jgi:hypothetical protein
MPLRNPLTLRLHCWRCAVQPRSLAAAQEAFFEPFDVLDRGRWLRSDGWSNGDWMNCDWSRDAARVSGGVLMLEVRAPGGPDLRGVAIARGLRLRHLRGPHAHRWRAVA